jgi:carboxymethylenebutenolidase
MIKQGISDALLTRRSALVALSACGLVGAARVATPARVIGQSVLVKTSDGAAEAALFYPARRGRWPAILLWPDYAGLRSLYRHLAARFASEGFVVLVPNIFYRSMRPSEAEPDPNDTAFRAKLAACRAAADDAAIARDTRAYFDFLDAQRQTDTSRKAATIGYDLGGSYAFEAAAALPDRIAAVGSVYGVSVAAARPNSPHLLVPRTKATYYVAIARDHDALEPDDKTQIIDIIKLAGLKGTVEVYPADRGWANPAAKSYDAQAEQRAFQALLKLLKSSLE